MWFTRLKSTIEKYRSDPLVAAGRYNSLFSLMLFLISAAAESFSSTSVAFEVKEVERGSGVEEGKGVERGSGRGIKRK